VFGKAPNQPNGSNAIIEDFVVERNKQGSHIFRLSEMFIKPFME
jgi:hypothetical protein